jgi:hypothetical protein
MKRGECSCSVRHDEPPYPGTPRWVKVFGIIALVLALLVVVMMLIDPDRHGPGRHLQSGAPASHIPPIEHGVQQP